MTQYLLKPKKFSLIPDRLAPNFRQVIAAIKIGLLGLAGFVLFTQEEYRPIVLAALAPVLPMLLKLPPGLDLSKLLDGIKLPKPG